MKTLGLIPPERLSNIPEARWREHEFCFHIHDLIVAMLIDMEGRKAGAVSFQFESEAEISLLCETDNVLDFLAGSGRSDLERRAVINHTSVALFADVSHYLHGALTALEKRKFTVAYTLLRKPLKEALLMAARMVANEEMFFEQLKSEAPALDVSATNADEKKGLIAEAINVMKLGYLFSADVLYQSIYDHDNAHGFAPLFDKATHLITKRRQIRTEDYNVNFIFKNPIDDDVYQDYFQIAYAILFLHALQIELFFRSKYHLPKYRNWLLFTSVGAFQSIFLKGRSSSVSGVNRIFGEFMQCPACEAQITLRKRSAPAFFITGRLECSDCGRAHQFPLQWFLARTDAETFGAGRDSGRKSAG